MAAATTSLARLRRLTPFVAPFFSRLLFVFVLSLFGATVGLLWPLFTKVLIDDVLLAKNRQLLFGLCGAMAAVTVLGYGVGAVTRYYYTQVTARILLALRQHLFSQLQFLSLRFHARVKLGDLLSRLNTDISEVQAVLTDTAFALVSNLLMLLVTVGFLLWLEWRLFLVSLVVVPFQLYSVMKIRPHMVEQTREVREVNAAIGSFLVESLSAIKFVKLFALEHLQLQRLGALGERFVRVVTRFEMLGYWGGSAATAATFFGGVLTTLYGGYLVIADQLTVGALIAFSAYQSRAFSPLQALVDLYLRFERAGVSLDRIFEFIDSAESNRESRSGTCRLAVVRGELEFRGVVFSYEANEPVLNDVSFQMPAGRRLTILGPSGAGKSTLVDLLARLYEPSGGQIFLDGHPLADFDLTWLRNQIAVVEHDPALFHSSVIENLRYASPEASVGEVEGVARMVGLHDFLSSLPQGYDTLVGERGMRFSTGQRQRLALARALLRQPRILVLDEALSGLDVASEAQVRSVLDTVQTRGMTVLSVTHRHSSLGGDDAVLVLDRGRVRWQGRYGAMPAAAGTVYAALTEWELRAAVPRERPSV